MSLQYGQFKDPWRRSVDVTVVAGFRFEFPTIRIQDSLPRKSTCPLILPTSICSGAKFVFGEVKFAFLSNLSVWLIPYPYLPCMVYLPTFGSFGWFLWQNVYVYLPYMDVMGFLVTRWFKPWPNFIPYFFQVTIHPWKGSRFHHPKKGHKELPGRIAKKVHEIRGWSLIKPPIAFFGRVRSL